VKLYKLRFLSICSCFIILTFAFSVANASESFLTVLGETLEKNSFSRCKLPDTSFGVRIGERVCGAIGGLVKVPVSLKSPPYPLVGFDFLISYDTNSLTFEAIEPADAYFSEAGCGWEYFNYRPNDGKVKVVGIADFAGNESTPNCRNAGSFSEMFNLVFIVKDVGFDLWGETPVEFCWNDCFDNQIWFNLPDDSLIGQLYRTAISSRVYSNDTSLPPADAFPSLSGPVDTCFSSAEPHQVRYKKIDFYNGGPDIYLVGPDSNTATCPIPVYGDVNWDGKHYKLNDALVFAKYFTHGYSAFQTNIIAQVKATDINEDGQKLKLEDLVQLVRIAIGELPLEWTFDSTLLGNNIIRNRSSGSSITLDNDHCTDLIWLRFRGEINPILPAESTFVISHFDGDDTRVLLLGLKGFAPGSHHLFHYTGTGLMIDAQAATLEGYEIPLTINDAATSIEEPDDILPSVFALHQNYPNPFNIETVIEFDLPNASEVRFEIINILGQVVYNVTSRHSAGSHTIYWDGSSNSGQTVGTGVYYYRITTGDFVSSKKMILLK